MQDSKGVRFGLVAIAALLNSGAVMVARSILQAPQDTLLCFLYGVLFAVIFNGIVLIFRRLNYKWIYLASLAVVMLILWRMGVIYEPLAELLDKYIIWFRQHDLATDEPSQFATTFTMVVAGLISSLYTTPFIAGKPRMLPILILFVTIIVLPYRYFDPAQMRVAETLIIGALLYLAVLSGYFRVASRNNGKISSRPYRTVGLALCAAIMVAMSLLSYGSEEEQSGIMSLSGSGSNFFREIFTGRVSHLKLNDTGKADLGGNNASSNMLLFDVRTDELFYYYSNTYDRYTGVSWESTAYSDLASDYHELTVDMYADNVYRREPAHDVDFSWLNNTETEPAQMSFLYHKLSTDRLLLPRGVDQINITRQGNNVIHKKYDLTFSVSPTAREGFTYTATAYKRHLRDVLDYITFTDNGLIVRASFILSNGLLAPTRFSDLQHFNQPRYLELPDSVTDRTRELAREIAADEFGYISIALALQKYLSETYPYSLDAPELPANTDFVDYFLFEAKTGYCTSYASAMVVMLRSLGIPARYCEGFAPSPENYEDGVYRVYADNAHAWVEMYTPTGWIELDPTGSENAAVYRAAQHAPRPEYGPAPDLSFPPEASTPPPDYADMYGGNDSTETEDSEDTELTGWERTLEWFIGFSKTVMVIFLIFLLPVSWVFGGRIYVKTTLSRLKKAPPTKQASFWYGHMMKLLKSEGLIIHPYETMRGFVVRVREKLPSSSVDLLPAIALMERVVYNDGVIAPHEINAFTSAHDQLSSGLHAGWSKFRQWIEKNVTFRSLWNINL